MNYHHDVEASPFMAKTPHGTDGALDRMLRLGHKQKVPPAIFIHAGAGFHSHQNENVHLQACVAAAEMGMRFLKAGASATEAVEASLRILEDKEITNAGYGSNLSIDGTVECDATIVDHLGRSGACGAVPCIRNPISLAKLILDMSNKPLSLRRVPPNALVGEGAKSFAEENGMITFSNEHLVSKNARDRFLRWQEDLYRAEGKIKELKPRSPTEQDLADFVPCQYDSVSSASVVNRTVPRDHAAAILAGTWNEGQPDSPYRGTPGLDIRLEGDQSSTSYFKSSLPTSAIITRPAMPAAAEMYQAGSANGAGSKNGSPSTVRPKQRPKKTDLAAQAVARSSANSQGNQNQTYRDVAASGVSRPLEQSDSIQQEPPPAPQPPQDAHGIKRPYSNIEESEATKSPTKRYGQPFQSRVDGEDIITDTIGAITIDDKGQIAAGSSSGGIGMKHRGRLGPAALVGIGTAVVPRAEDDEDGISVAAVTSGTGEHMATTMASQRCAERIYRGTRKGAGGADILDDDEDAIMESFIADDFMDHAGVKNCHSAGAIGVMVVKKAKTGYYLYFAHNTDSFALASMGGTDKEPVCTMSRLPEGANIAKGGRKIRVD